MQVIGIPKAITPDKGGGLGLDLGAGIDISGGALGGAASALPTPQELCEQFRWINGHLNKPDGIYMSLFELEALIARRMELLALVDQRLNAPNGKGVIDAVDFVSSKFYDETRTLLANSSAGSSKSTAGSTQSHAKAAAKERLYFTPEEEVISHSICRYAFCLSEKWRSWFVKIEDILYRGRLKALMERNSHLIDVASKAAELPLRPAPKNNEKMNRVVEHLAKRYSIQHLTMDDICLVPFQNMLRGVKTREVVCVNGYAVVLKKDLTELMVNQYRVHLNRSLQEALRRRSDMYDEDESEQANVYAMVDAFLTRFISDPAAAIKQTPTGAVNPSDIPHLSQTHFPLCMQRAEAHLQHQGHVKHHGRWMYGLFLKNIGLSLQGSLEYWAHALRVKGGAADTTNIEPFKKGEYGYGLRHMYGQEGKRTSYSSLTCTSIITGPPEIDRYDCHGCPFKFKDEGRLRALLAGEKVNPFNQTRVSLMASDIEDIVADSQGSHYTRACYKYYAATHRGVPRDNLFRSPYEYYTVSLDAEHLGESKRANGHGEEGGETPDQKFRVGSTGGGDGSTGRGGGGSTGTKRTFINRATGEKEDSSAAKRNRPE